MGHDEYKRQQDLLFQQTEEKAMLARQAKEAKIAKAMKKKGMQKAIAGLARVSGASPEQMQKIVEKQLRELDGSDSD
jgi:hypothetical protein